MSAISQSIPAQSSSTSESSNQADVAIHEAFLRFLPAVETHAKIQFRRLPVHEREEAIAEATAAAFLNVHSSVRNGTAKGLTPSTVAGYAVLHVRDGRHVGGRRDRKTDVLSPRAQREGRFRVRSLNLRGWPMYDCLTAPDEGVWRDHLLCDRRTPPPDQAAFRLDFSSFVARQNDRTRRILAMLAAGHRQMDVADLFGITPSAVCQRQKRTGREWDLFQGASNEADQAVAKSPGAVAVA